MARFVSEKRSKVTFGVRDLDQIATFEAQLKAQGTPLSKYFEIYKGIKETEKAKKLKKEMDDYKHIPEVKAKKAGKTTSEFKGIFGDEDMDEDDDDMKGLNLKRIVVRKGPNRIRKLGWMMARQMSPSLKNRLKMILRIVMVMKTMMMMRKKKPMWLKNLILMINE